MRTLLLATLAAVSTGAAANPEVVLSTSKGDIRLELYEKKAPKTVANFLEYVRSGQYDGTVFHRVIPGFMIQGGGYTQDLSFKPTRDPIENEADNGLSNERGTIAMARKGDPDSATAQFFISDVDNERLDHQSAESGRTWGYAVFGRVVEGLDVVDEIALVETGSRQGMQNVPVENVVIEKVSIVERGSEQD